MGKAKGRKKLDPNYGKVPSNKGLPDFGHWWQEDAWEEGDILILTIASDSSVSLATQTEPQLLGFSINCADGRRRKGDAEFPDSAMAEKFLETIALVHSPPSQGGISVILTLDPNKGYITSLCKQVCPLNIQNFEYETDIENPNNTVKLLESMNLRDNYNRIVFAAAR